MKIKVLIGLTLVLIPAFLLTARHRSTPNRPTDFRDAVGEDLITFDEVDDLFKTEAMVSGQERAIVLYDQTGKNSSQEQFDRSMDKNAEETRLRQECGDKAGDEQQLCLKRLVAKRYLDIFGVEQIDADSSAGETREAVRAIKNEISAQAEIRAGYTSLQRESYRIMNEPKAAQYFDSESKAQLVNETRRQQRENVEHCRAERARGVLPSECLREGFEAIRENAYLRMKKADKDLKVKEESKAAVESSKQHSVDRENKVGEYGKQFNKSWGDNSGAGPDAEAVVLGGRDSKANIVKPTGETPTVPTSRRGPTRKLIAHKPPVLEISEDLQGMKDYAQINKENKFTGAMAEVDKDGASGGTVNAAKAAGLKTIFQISKDFDETFLNNPSPKDEDVRMVIDKIKSKAKNPDDAWEIAKLMRDKRDFPALRDAEHYLWSCSRTTGSKWDGAATLVVTPLYSMAKLPGLRKIFFDDATSPPSVSEMKWGAKGVKDCWK